MRVAIFFATREGHTRRIAARIAADLEKDGALVDGQPIQGAVDAADRSRPGSGGV
jgi:menaquinone-dependent protoporphyrinogen IX oxidase